MLSMLSLKRRDIWPSRSAAIDAAQKSHKRWDSRVFERWVQHGYRDLPTALYPQDPALGKGASCFNANDHPVTLASSKHQEVMQYVRPNFKGHKALGQEDNTQAPPHDPLIQPDVIGPCDKVSPFYRSEPVIAWKMLDHIRPSVLYIIGEQSPISTKKVRAELLHRTGAGVGGSGGVKNSQVKERIIRRSGHQVPLEMVEGTASALGEWINWVVLGWKENEKRVAQGWENRSPRDRLRVSSEWMPRLESVCKVPTLPERNSKI
jgi:hypothetical protein